MMHPEENSMRSLKPDLVKLADPVGLTNSTPLGRNIVFLDMERDG
jgi:hypothetical protein